MNELDLNETRGEKIFSYILGLVLVSVFISGIVFGLIEIKIFQNIDLVFLGETSWVPNIIILMGLPTLVLSILIRLGNK